MLIILGNLSVITPLSLHGGAAGTCLALLVDEVDDEALSDECWRCLMDPEPDG